MFFADLEFLKYLRPFQKRFENIGLSVGYIFGLGRFLYVINDFFLEDIYDHEIFFFTFSRYRNFFKFN
jgi:hypothetical protein